MSIEFKDNSAQVKSAIDKAASAFLYEAGQLLQARARDEVRVDTGETRRSYDYKVVEESNSGTVYVGSDKENAIYEEYGTGEYALAGNGRKGGWAYKSEKDGKFYRTNGKKPTKPLATAFANNKSAIVKRAEKVFKDL